jgi:hypothetical protein
MLHVTTEEQRHRIEEILSSIEIWELDKDIGLYINDSVSFDKLAELVDYLRSVNKQKKNELDMSIVAPDMIEVVKTWLAYKKEKNQTYKPTGFKAFYKSLCELSGNNSQVAMAIIEQSMQNNYAGIFPLRNNNNNNYGRPKTNSDKFIDSVREANDFAAQLRANIGKQADMGYGDSEEVW